MVVILTSSEDVLSCCSHVLWVESGRICGDWQHKPVLEVESGAEGDVWLVPDAPLLDSAGIFDV